jgi:hypothetical protein
MDTPRPPKKSFPIFTVFFAVMLVLIVVLAATSLQPRAEGQPATGGWQTIPRNELPPQR